MKKLYFIISLLTTSVCSQLNAQTQDVDFTGNCNFYMGLSSTQICAQSFTAGLTGTLSSVSADITVDNVAMFNPVDSNNNPISEMSFTAQIYSGDGCSGTLLSSQTFSIPFGNSRNMVNIAFASPAQVTATQVYTLKITPISGQNYNDPMDGATPLFARWYMTGCSGSAVYSGTPYVNCNANSNDFFFKTFVNTGNLGVMEGNINKNISITPNPAQNELKINGITKNEEYTIYDLSGKKILGGTTNKNEEINISKLEVGQYLLKINNKTIKFIKK